MVTVQCSSLGVLAFGVRVWLERRGAATDTDNLRGRFAARNPQSALRLEKNKCEAASQARNPQSALRLGKNKCEAAMQHEIRSPLCDWEKTNARPLRSTKSAEADELAGAQRHPPGDW